MKEVSKDYDARLRTFRECHFWVKLFESAVKKSGSKLSFKTFNKEFKAKIDDQEKNKKTLTIKAYLN